MVRRPVPYPDEPPNIEKDTLYPYLSPLLDRLTTPQNLVPAGDFLLPICTTSERMLALLKVIRAGADALDLQFVGSHSIDLLEALAHLDNPTDTPCLSVDGDLCRLYKPSSSIFSWELWSPFSSDPFPSGYNRAPFVLYDPNNLPAWAPQWVLDNLLGLQPGDVFTHIDAFASTSLQDFLNTLTNPIEELPYFVINATGGNTLRLKLFGVPQGGFVRIYTRNIGNSGIIFDLDAASVLDSELSDLLNLIIDGELFPEHIVDYDVPGEGAQEVVVVFLPDYSGGVSVGFGGGIRSVEVCGEVVEVEPEFRIENCILEWRPDTASNWIQLGNVCGTDGQDGADGLPAPTPVVQITAIPGGTHVAFDMDADLEFEDSFDVLNGQDGTDAPVPTLTVNAVEGGQNLGFDLDGDNIPDQTIFLPDGLPGADGQDAPVPLVYVNAAQKSQGGQTVDGVLVQFDMDADASIDAQFSVYDGFNGADAEGTTPPTGFDATEKCNAAFYIAGKIGQIAKDAAYESIVNANTGAAWWALFKSFFDFNPVYDPSLAMLDYIEQQISDYNAFATEIDTAQPRLAELLYCDPSDLLRTSAITNWDVEPISATVSADAKEVIYRAILATSLSEWAIYLQDGLLQTGGDCSGFCPPSVAQTVYDFTVSDGGWFRHRPAERPYGTYLAATGWQSDYFGSLGVNRESHYLQSADFALQNVTEVRIYADVDIWTGAKVDVARVVRDDDTTLQINNGAVTAVAGGFMRTYTLSGGSAYKAIQTDTQSANEQGNTYTIWRVEIDHT